MPFLQIAFFAIPFCVLHFCVMPLCVLPFCVLALCVMPVCVMPVCVMPFSARYLYDSGFFSISSFNRSLFFSNFDSAYFRFDLTLFNLGY